MERSQAVALLVRLFGGTTMIFHKMHFLRLFHTRLPLGRSGYVPIILIFGVLVGLSWLDRHGYLLSKPSDMTLYDRQEAHVLRVIDGDTFVIDVPDHLNRDGEKSTTTVRLWGIDCPEIAKVGPNPQPAEPWADEATDYVRSLIENGTVQLHLEAERTRGHFGRVLVHAMLEDGSSVAEMLLERGLTRADPRWSHCYFDEYAQLEQTAKSDRVGVWSENR